MEVQAKTGGIGLFYRNYRPLFEGTSWLGAGLHQCVLRNKLAGSENVVSLSRKAPVDCLISFVLLTTVKLLAHTPPNSSAANCHGLLHVRVGCPVFSGGSIAIPDPKSTQ